MKKALFLALLVAMPFAASAQDDGDAGSNRKKEPAVTFNGSVQSDILIPQEDDRIGTGSYKDWGLTNTYVDVNLNSKYVDAGTRFQFTQYPLPGYEQDFKGWGIPYFYVKGKYKWAELTAGDYYEQFGSGLILRTYEERSIGVDNALRGGRLVLRPVEGLQIKLGLDGRRDDMGCGHRTWA